MATTSRKSRAVLHYQRRNSAGNLNPGAACHGRGTHLVGLRFYKAVTCESCMRLAEEDQAKEVRDIIVSMGLRSRVIAIYDNAQTIACESETYTNHKQAGNEDKADFHAHQQAIQAVRAILVEDDVITSDTAERIVNLAYTEIT